MSDLQPYRQAGKIEKFPTRFNLDQLTTEQKFLLSGNKICWALKTLFEASPYFGVPMILFGAFSIFGLICGLLVLCVYFPYAMLLLISPPVAYGVVKYYRYGKRLLAERAPIDLKMIEGARIED